jgi:hypothetical protein
MKFKKIIVAFSLFFFAALNSLNASEEQIIFPSEISITANAGEPFGEVTVEIIADKALEASKIKSIRLKINGEWQSVPERAFSDLENVFIQTPEIRIEKGYDNNPWLYIYFELPHRMESDNYLPRRVHIAYHKNKFEFRSIDTPISENAYKSDRVELN